MMFAWDDILIIGDSFCANRGREYEWPQQLVCELTGEAYRKDRLPRGQGFPGASWWSTRNAFLEEIKRKPVKLIIVCHTDANRIPNNSNLPLNSRSRFEDKDFDAAVQGYYKHLWCTEFHQWSNRAWFAELDYTCKKENIQAVHVHCFDSEHIFTNGLTITEAWKHHAVLTSFDPHYTDISNHFAPITNQRLGQNLAKLIKQWNGESGKVTGTLFNDSGFEIKGL